MAEITRVNDDLELIKSLELAVNCLKRARDFPGNRHTWMSIARNQVTRASMFMDDELEYSKAKIEANEVKRLQAIEDRIGSR